MEQCSIVKKKLFSALVEATQPSGWGVFNETPSRTYIVVVVVVVVVESTCKALHWRLEPGTSGSTVQSSDHYTTAAHQDIQYVINDNYFYTSQSIPMNIVPDVESCFMFPGDVPSTGSIPSTSRYPFRSFLQVRTNIMIEITSYNTS